MPPLLGSEGPLPPPPPAGQPPPQGSGPPEPDPVLCGHCGRTARNGLTCQGICVADSGY